MINYEVIKIQSIDFAIKFINPQHSIHYNAPVTIEMPSPSVTFGKL